MGEGTKNGKNVEGESLEFEGLGSLPCEVRVFATEVAVGGSLLEDRSAEVEVSDDSSGAEVEVGIDDFGDLGVGLSGAGEASSVSINEDGEGVRNTDGVGELHEDSVAETGSDKGLSDPAGCVGSRAVDLGGVLSREGSTTVGAPATVGINDDLAASKTGITVRTTNDEASRGVKVVDGLLVEVLGGDDGLDDVLHELGLDLLVGDVLRVLGGDDDGVNTLGDGLSVLHLVLAGHLGLAIGAHPRADTVLAHLSELGTKGGGKVVGEGHQRWGLVGGIAEHDTLIASSNVLELGGINGLGNVGGLLLNCNDDIASAVIKTLGNIVVANVLECLTDNLLVVDGGRGGDLTEDHNHASLGAGLASNTRSRILADACIKHCIRDLIANLVRVALIDRLGGEKESVRHGF